MLRPDFALPATLRSSLLVFHIVASLAAYACFTMAAILAGMYLVLHGKLKHKNFDITFRKLPPLEKLDKLSANWSFLGSSIMVVSSIIGITWVRKDGLAGMGLNELAIYLVLLVFIGAGVSRQALGRARQAPCPPGAGRLRGAAAEQPAGDPRFQPLNGHGLAQRIPSGPGLRAGSQSSHRLGVPAGQAAPERR